jgi:hypothetical protein
MAERGKTGAGPVEIFAKWQELFNTDEVVRRVTVKHPSRHPAMKGC